MRVAAVQENRMDMYELENGISIPLACGDLVFRRSGDAFCMDLPAEYHVLKSGGIREGEMIILGEVHSLRTVQLYFSDTSHREGFRRYRLQKPVTIGTSVEDDFCYRSDFLTPSCVKIDPLARTITVCEGTPAACSGKRIHGCCSYRDGDVLLLPDTKILLSRYFLAVPDSSLLSTIVPAAIIPFQDVLPQSRRKDGNVELVEGNLPSFETEIIIHPFRDLKKKEERPLFLTAGPSLMMSFASFCCALLMGWEAERSGTQLTAMILFPVMMMLSTLLFTPLSRIYERHSNERQRKETVDHYCMNMNKKIVELEEKRKACTLQMEQQFPSYGSYRVRLKTGTNPLYIRIGKADHQLDMKFVLPSDMADLCDPIKEVYEEMQRMERDTEFRPLIRDLLQYRIISVDPSLKETLLPVLLDRIGAAGGHAILLFAEQEQLCLRKMLNASALFTSDGFRLAAATAEECSMLEPLLKEESYIVFVLNASLLPEKWKSDHRFRVFIGMQEEQADLRICCQDGQYRLTDRYDPCPICFLPDPPADFPSSSFLNYYSAQNNGFLSLFRVGNASGLSKAYSDHPVLRVPIGWRNNGDRILLDLSENEDGPHGLIAGSTGSGKSELLSTMLLSLAVNNTPDQLQFVLIDFKGGGVSSAFTKGEYPLKHVIGELTNLDADSRSRCLFAFRRNCLLRQQEFRRLSEASGRTIRKLDDYRQYFSGYSGFGPFAELVVVVDEFAEMKSECPEFLKELISIARIGRSLGVHLLLATQKPSGSISDEIRANMRFRICLRTAERADSMEVLHRPDAAALQNPGEFLLQKDRSLIHGQCAYANAPMKEEGQQSLLLSLQRKRCASVCSEGQTGKNELQMVLQQIASYTGQNREIRPFWLPALPPLSLSQLADEPYGFAVSDDVEQGVQRIMHISDYRGTSAFFSENYAKRSELLHVLRDCVIASSGRWFSLEQNDDLEKFEQLRTKHALTENCYGVIEDLSKFLQSNLQREQLLETWMDESEQEGFHVILLLNSLSLLRYRLQEKLRIRFAMSDLNPREIFEILGQRVNVPVSYEQGGYYVKDRVIAFRYASRKEEGNGSSGSDVCVSGGSENL